MPGVRSPMNAALISPISRGRHIWHTRVATSRGSGRDRADPHRSGCGEHETESDGEADRDTQDSGAPGRDIDRTERLLDVTVVVVTVVVTMIVGRVVGDRTSMA